MKQRPTIYRINFINQSQVYELYAKNIATNALLGFMSISDILFDLRDAVVIDPVEEQLKAEFKDVEVLHIPLTQILKVEEVKKKKSCKIRQLHTSQITTTMKTQPGPSK